MVFFEVIENELKSSKIGQNLQIWALYAYSAYLSIAVPALTFGQCHKTFYVRKLRIILIG